MDLTCLILLTCALTNWIPVEFGGPDPPAEDRLGPDSESDVTQTVVTCGTRLFVEHVSGTKCFNRDTRMNTTKNKASRDRSVRPIGKMAVQEVTRSKVGNLNENKQTGVT